MMRLHSVFPIVAASALSVALGGCAVAVIGGVAAAGGAGYVVAQERGVDGTVDDFTLQHNIGSALSQANPPLQADVSVTVFQGRALLTGQALSPQAKEQARQLASSVPGVRNLYDEIEVGGLEDNWGVAKDSWITARLRSELMLEPEVRSVNYTIETAGQSVYLIGSARSQAELDRATELARYVPDVRRVVSYVEIRPGAPVAAQPAPPPPPATAQYPDSPTAAPQAPVEVQKL